MSNTNDNPPGNSRRRVLKTLGLMGAGAVLMPDKWIQPVVNSLIEPAEAGCVTSVQGQSANCPNGGIPLPGTTIIPTTTPASTTTPTPTTTQPYI